MSRQNLHPAFALLLLLAAALLFIRLGSSEIQSWDEGLYAIRTDAIVAHGAWLDQTGHSLGGLYSSTHPPVAIWFMAVSEALFGRNEWALRLPGAVLGALSILLLHKLLSRVASANSAAVVTLAIAVSSSFVFITRHAQLDIYLYFFALASLYLYARDQERGVVRSLVIPGVLFGLALLSKFGFAALFVPLFWAVAPKVRTRYALAVLVIAAVIAIPWYVWMRMQYPDFGLHALNVASDPGYEATQHAWWYYVNQIVVAVPLVMVMLVPGAYDRGKPTLIVLASIFVVLLLLVSMATSLAAYVVLFFLPLALFLGPAMDRQQQSQRPTQSIVLGVIAVAWLWGASEQFRMLVKGVRGFVLVIPMSELIVALVLFVGALVLLQRATILYLAIGAMLATTLGQRLHYVAFTSPTETGARGAVAQLAVVRSRNPLVLTGNGPHEELMPQLSYYLDGIAVSRIREQQLTGVPDTFDAVIVQRHEDRLAGLPSGTRASWQRTDSLLALRFSRKLRSGCYVLYYRLRD